MLRLSLLIAHWERRLVDARVRSVLDLPPGSLPVWGDWVSQVRVRIFEFLISRYTDPSAAELHETRLFVGPVQPPATQCNVEPVLSPPRHRATLAGLIRAINDSNQEARDLLRWRLF